MKNHLFAKYQCHQRSLNTKADEWVCHPKVGFGPAKLQPHKCWARVWANGQGLQCSKDRVQDAYYCRQSFSYFFFTYIRLQFYLFVRQHLRPEQRKHGVYNAPPGDSLFARSPIWHLHFERKNNHKSHNPHHNDNQKRLWSTETKKNVLAMAASTKWRT